MKCIDSLCYLCLKPLQWALIYPTSIYPEDWGTKSAAYYCIDTFLSNIWFIRQVLREQTTSDKSEPRENLDCMSGNQMKTASLIGCSFSIIIVLAKCLTLFPTQAIVQDSVCVWVCLCVCVTHLTTWESQMTNFVTLIAYFKMLSYDEVSTSCKAFKQSISSFCGMPYAMNWLLLAVNMPPCELRKGSHLHAYLQNLATWSMASLRSPPPVWLNVSIAYPHVHGIRHSLMSSHHPVQMPPTPLPTYQPSWVKWWTHCCVSSWYVQSLSSVE